jgi:hypothetical protein
MAMISIYSSKYNGAGVRVVGGSDRDIINEYIIPLEIWNQIKVEYLSPG